MTDTSLAVTELRSTWHALSDLDRSQAVMFAYQSGIGLRTLAAALNCSPALLSYLLQAGQASPEDCVLARQSILSTRELVRRAKAVGARLTALHGEEVAFERERAAYHGCKSVLKWLTEQGVAVDRRTPVIDEALELLFPRDRAGRVFSDLAKATAVGFVMPRSPSQSDPVDVDSVTVMAESLAQWALSGILDSRIRQRALQLAREQPHEKQGNGVNRAAFDG